MSALRRLNLKIVAFFVIVSSVISPLVFVNNASADFWGGRQAVGYFNCFFNLNAFHEDSESGHGKVIPIRMWKDGVTGRFLSNTNEFITRLQQAYGQGGQNQTGAAFLVKAMLGYEFCPGGNRGPSTDRNVSSAQWEDLRRRVTALESQGRINWRHLSYSSSSTSMGSDKFVGRWGGAPSYTYYAGYDVAGRYYPQTDDAIVMNLPSGGQVVIFYECGNTPVDKLEKLPNLDFNLTPTVSVTPSMSESGGRVSVTPTVNNSPGTTASSTVDWKVTTFTLDSGETVPNGGESSASAESFYGHDASSVRTGRQAFNRGVTTLPVISQTIGDFSVGTRVCYTLTVRPYSHTSTNARHSAPACILIMKMPKVQILGGDVSAGKSFSGSVVTTSSDIITSRSIRTINGQARSYGSWVEYGARATGRIDGFGAGSAYSGGLLNATICGANLLTFSNTNGSSCSRSERLGYYSNMKQIPDVASTFAVNRMTPEYRSLADAASRRVVRANSNITINGGRIEAGDWLVINAANHVVTINGNITYTDQSLTSINDIPQLVIIADRINITDRVQRIDAWLVADGQNGVINTCSNVAQLTARVCDEQLVVNGPVMAKSLLLRRTHGAGQGNEATVAAEIFNLRPDAYLWSIAKAKSANRIQSVYVRELPPRF